MERALRQFIGDDGGQDLIEYALLCALLAVACITVLLQLTQIREFFAAAGAALDAAI
jgi:Flp pilus assembly pilin Flp